MFNTDKLLEMLDLEEGDLIVDTIIDDDGRERVQLCTLEPGARFSIGDICFIVLETNPDGSTVVIQEDFLPDRMVFGETSDWRDSPIRTKLNGEYLDKISSVVGIDNISIMERNLISRDGLDDYGTCEDRISIMSESEYARYHKILGLRSSYDRWWWTITPISTPSNDYSHVVCCVGSDGVLSWDYCCDSYGVRPFFYLDSSIFVYKSEAKVQENDVFLF